MLVSKETKLCMFLGAVLISNHLYATPLNISCAKRDVIKYFTSNDFNNEVSKVVKEARLYLSKRVEENSHARKPEKLAIVLDIDDTSLSNFENKRKYDFSGLQSGIDESYREAKAKPIVPVLELYNDAIKNGVAAFFISFRPDDVRSYTIINLQKAGFYGWKGLFLPNTEEIKLPAQKYKTSIRRNLTHQGYKIILSLGDQSSDLDGGYVEHVTKIPNPLYTSSIELCPNN